MRTSAIKLIFDPRVLLSALLLSGSFSPWDFHLLIWIALVPWLFALDASRSRREVFLRSLGLSIAFTIFSFHWVGYAISQYGNLPRIIGYGGLVIFSLFNQLQFALFGLARFEFLKRFPSLRHSLIATLFLSAAYTSIDWIFPKLFTDTLGHSFWNASWLRQGADLFGAYGLTFIIVFTNFTLQNLRKSFKKRDEPSLWPSLTPNIRTLGLLILFQAGLITYGYIQYKAISEAERNPVKTVRMAGIQANIGDFEKVASENGVSGAAEKVVAKYFKLSDDALAGPQKPELIIWPETAYPSTFRVPFNPSELARDQKVEQWVRTRGVPLAFGGYDHQNQKDYNSLFFLSPKGDLQTYHKSVLLMFGEYIPGGESITWIKNAFPQVGYFGQGPGPQVYSIRTAKQEIRITPIICYEALFPGFLIEGARKGAEMILNITNDSWFGPQGEPHLHFALSVFRSIETRRSQLRVTNTGFSGLILPSGDVQGRTELNSEVIITSDVPVLAPPSTLMLKLGDWFGYFAVLLTALIYAVLPKPPRKRSAR